MKITLTVLFSLVQLALAVDKNALEQESIRISEQATSHITSAQKRAGVNDGNLIQFVKELKKIGFGEAPGPHPDDEKEAGNKKLTEKEREEVEHRKQEYAARMKMIGQEDVKFLKKLDLNEDLTLSEKESNIAIGGYLKAFIAERLSVDSNGDRKLTLKEYALSVPARGEIGEDGVDWHQRGHFNSEDANKDGLVDELEMVKYISKYVRKRAVKLELATFLISLDKNKDNEITEEEWLANTDKANSVWKKIVRNRKSLPTKDIWPSIYWLGEPDAKLVLVK